MNLIDACCEYECYFCGAWCCDTEDELIGHCEVCDCILCVDCSDICVSQDKHFLVCIDCEPDKELNEQLEE